MSALFTRNLLLLIVATGAIVAGHLLPGLDNSRVEDGIRNGLHVLVFAVFAAAVYRRLRHFGTFKLAVITLAVVLITGVASEAVQYLSGRQPDLRDVFRDVSGAALALSCMLLWRWSGLRKRSTGMVILARTMAMSLCVAILAPLTFWLVIVGMGRMAAPVILNFEQWWQVYIYRPVNAEITSPGASGAQAEIELLEWRRSGMIVSPLLTDWSSYQHLVITARMLRGPETNVSVRINDGPRVNEWSDAFMEPILVGPESAELRIPLLELAAESGHAVMLLDDIQELVIFARDRRKDTVMLIEEIRLD